MGTACPSSGRNSTYRSVQISGASSLYAADRKKKRSGRQQHWQAVDARNHLGWLRWQGDTTGRWILRRYRNGRYNTEPIGVADDKMDADGISVLDYQQARAKAVELSADDKRPAGRLTVKQAMIDYIRFLKADGKGTATAESSAARWIVPKLGRLEVAAITSQQFREWKAWVAKSGIIPEKNNGISADEMLRRRRVSANRHLADLKSALNHAFKEGRVSSNVAWSGERVEKYRNVASKLARYLTVDEAKRFLDGCDPIFRPLARAALETGMRYSELARLQVVDFNKDSGTVFVKKSKAAVERDVVLTPEGARFFSDACECRQRNELIFTREGAAPWGHGNQGWYVKQANERGGIDPPITFHTTRHTWASWAVMGGVPLTVVAKQLGHVDTTMVEKTYGHLAPSYITEAIRKGAPRFV